MLKAADVLGDPGGRYSAAAAAAGEDIWRRGLLKKVGRGTWLLASWVQGCSVQVRSGLKLNLMQLTALHSNRHMVSSPCAR